jgi:hypothetical protein
MNEEDQPERHIGRKLSERSSRIMPAVASVLDVGRKKLDIIPQI